MADIDVERRPARRMGWTGWVVLLAVLAALLFWVLGAMPGGDRARAADESAPGQSAP